ncbi:MAG: hypothetical protein B6241_08240 [Spirochaetaceae bacterium 4572_59]|nr:MAG: hypothetical protein B6241_08240 [Spirochaetaceae bacterium 4572_59]
MDISAQAFRWFTSYVSDFKTEQNIILKEEHTEKVVLEAVSLARILDWPEEDIILAGLIARFHDLARFEQFSRFKTFKDKDSKDHGDWGVELFEELNPLPPLMGEDRRILLSAIRYHNKKSIPGGLTERERQHCRLIRDADKIDIYRVVTGSDVSFTGVGSCEDNTTSPYLSLLIDNLLNGIQSDNTHLKTREELILLQLGWIYDLNYLESLRIIDRRGYLNLLIEELPEGQDRDRIEKHIQKTVAEKLSNRITGSKAGQMAY